MPTLVYAVHACVNQEQVESNWAHYHGFISWILYERQLMSQNTVKSLCNKSDCPNLAQEDHMLCEFHEAYYDREFIKGWAKMQKDQMAKEFTINE